MASVLYKDGETIYVPVERLQACLNAGWSVTKEPKLEPKAEVKTFEEVDTNDSGKLSSEEVRDAAEAAGIKNWEKKRIKTLKSELGIE